MKTIHWILLKAVQVTVLLTGTLAAIAQVDGAMNMEEMKKLANATPQQLEAYKKEQIQKAKQQMVQYGLPVTDLPAGEGLYGSSIPAKNIKALVKAAGIVPDKTILLSLLATMQNALLLRLTAEVKAEVKNTLQKETAPVLSSYAASLWYTNRQESALITAIGSVQKEPGNPLFWNNLGAFCNLSGLEGMAIPIMKYCLLLSPRSSMAYNNLGQAYLGLGDRAQARKTLEHCILLDSLNPEANRSLALLDLDENRTQDAVRHLSAELRVAFRQTSDALIKNEGLEEQIPYAALFEQGNARRLSSITEQTAQYEQSSTHGPKEDDIPISWREENKVQHDRTSSFLSFSLNRIEMPPFPKNLDQADSLQGIHAGFQQKVLAEMAFFMSRAGSLTEGEQQIMRYKTVMYDNWATPILNDLMLHEFPLLTITDEAWIAFSQDWNDQYKKAIDAVKDNKQWSSDEELCKAIHKVTDHYINMYCSYIENRYSIIQTRYKIFIDHIGELVSMAPNHASTLYSMVASYLGFMASASGLTNTMTTFQRCNPSSYDPVAPGWGLNHLVEMFCAQGIGGSLPLGVIKGKLDCEGLSFSGSAELIKFGIEKKFKTGTSTFWISGGVEADFKDVFKVEATEKIFVVWDKNNVCTDAGLSGTGKLGVENIGSTEFGYSFGVSSGFEAGFANENELSGSLNKVLDFL